MPLTSISRPDLWNYINEISRLELQTSISHVLKKTNSPEIFLGEELPHPLTYLSYSELANSWKSGNGIDKSLTLLNQSLRIAKPDYFEVLPWSGSKFTQDEWDLIYRSMSAEPAFPRILTTPPEQIRHAALFYLSLILPELKEKSPLYHNLLRNTINTIVLAEPQDKNFGGATYFFFWGGTVVNSKILNLPHKYFYEQLIHEACHMALFMLCSRYGLLCENPDTELYSSAFRPDSGRPMHGLIHAYFVSCNLVECFRDIPHMSEIVHKNAQAAHFLHEEILTHAKLTDFGRVIFSAPEIEFVESNIEL